MQLYTQDKAIEFNALYNDVKRVINNYKKIGIDVSAQEKEADRIYQQYNSSVSIGAIQAQAEVQYSEGIKELNKIIKEIEEKHEVYYSAYQEAESIQVKINKNEISNEQLKAFATATIALLNQIQNSDTRAYQSEKTIVEKIYSLAYNIIKLEIILNGKSEVLEKIRKDSVAASYINSLIEIDIALINEKDIANDVIKETISALTSKKITHSYLDEGLILFIAMQKKSSIKLIESNLLEIIKDITKSDEDLEATKTNNSVLEDKINELKSTIKKSKIYKELALAASLIGLLAGLKYGSEEIAKTFGHNEYKTDIDFYSSIGAEAPEYPEYMPKIENFNKTTLTAYDVWRQEGIFFGEYQRNIVTYDLSKIDISALEDFMNYDFSELSKTSEDTETAEELNVDELYDKAIVEIIRLTQDENNSTFVPNEEAQEIFLIITSIIGAVLGGLGELAIFINIIKKLKSNHNNRVLRKESVEEWEEGLKKYKTLCNENEEFRKRFIDMYQKFSKFIKDSKIKEQYQRILKKENEEEI